jgi:hypothetical protein
MPLMDLVALVASVLIVGAVFSGVAAAASKEASAAAGGGILGAIIGGIVWVVVQLSRF